MVALIAKPRAVVRVSSGAVVLTGMLAGLLACGEATTPTPALDLAHTYWALRFNQHAVTLALTAPQNTIALTATPVNITGQALSGLGPVQYTTRDSAVTVDATGVVTAHFVTDVQNTIVVATVADTVHHLTHTDTCFIQVTATTPPSPLASFTLQSGSGDTIPVGNAGISSLSASATDADGNAVAAFPYFTSADSSIAQINKWSGQVLGVRTGQVFLYATTWAYGVAKRDSLAVTIGQPTTVTVNVLPVTPTGSAQAVLTFWPQTIVVGPGAVVTWVNKSLTDSMDVVFDDPTHVDSANYGNIFIIDLSTGRGNIAPWVEDITGGTPLNAEICTRFGYVLPDCNHLNVFRFTQQRKRAFPLPGTYPYHSAIWGTHGTIIVQ